MSGLMFGHFDKIDSILQNKYVSTEITDSSPQITTIQYNEDEPVIMEGGNIICECNRIIKQNYHAQHISSGACERRKQLSNYGKKP